MKYKRRRIKNLIILAGGLFGASVLFLPMFGNAGFVLAYDNKTTHPALTREIIDFYEISFDKKLTDEQGQWMIAGSVEEDRIPRWINHFFDPVFKRGLTTSVFGVSGYPSKDWARFSSYQTRSVANISTWWGDFSYEAAIKSYSEDKEKDAFIALGHILHLIEDMTVPEHTRNDMHFNDSFTMQSFYENWAMRNFSGLTQGLASQLFFKENKPVVYSDLETYFDRLASYSNNYFFSPRSINSAVYSKPKIIYEDGTFAYGKDENGEIFDLARIEKDFVSKEIKYSINKNQVLQEYWSRLSKQAIVNGAGVIQMFLNQGELARQELNKTNPQKSSLLSQIYGFFAGLFGEENEPDMVIVSELPATQSRQVLQPQIPQRQQVAQQPQTAPSAPAKTSAPKTVLQPAAATSTVQQPQSQQSQTQTQTQTNAPIIYGGGSGFGSGGGGGSSSNSNPDQSSNTTSISTSTPTEESPNIQVFNPRDIIINEIMYDLEDTDGVGSDSHAHEWIEIYNNSASSIDLTNWKFDDDATSLHGLNEPPTNSSQGSMMVPASGYAILSGNAATFLTDHPGFSGTVIDTVMGLKNSTSTIKILASDKTIIDEVTYSNSWGANGDGKTLERKSATGGSSDAANWAPSSAPGGTPGATNNWELSTSDVDSSATTATSSPPLSNFGTDIPATTTIAVNTTWTLSGSPYRIFFDGQRRPVIAANTTLTIEPGVKIIPQGGNFTALEVKGMLKAIGTAEKPIVFTSENDGKWLNIVFSENSQATLDYVEFRYGGQGNSLPLHEMVNIIGATVNINHSKFENSRTTALHLVDSSGIVENSIFSDNNCGISVDSASGVANTTYGGCYGIHTVEQNPPSTTLQIRNNQFIRNQLTGIETRSGTSPTIDNNIFTDNGYPIVIESSYPLITNSQLANSTTSPSFLGGIVISSFTSFSKDYILKKDLPYILEASGSNSSPYVASGATLTIEPGVILKPNHIRSAIQVSGKLIAQGSFFTSFKDDSRGGDTNGDGSTSSPQNNDWANIKFLAGSIGHFFNTLFDYAGYGFIPHNLPPTNAVAKDFPAVSTGNNFMGISTSKWIAEHNYNFDKIIFHKFSTVNPQNFDYLVGIKDSRNNLIALRKLSNLQNTGEIELTMPVQGQFTTGETYYAIIQVDQPTGTTAGVADSFSIGKDEFGMAAVAFYELVPGAPANPALSIESGASVVVQ